jgi:vacuolar iron transporter family protein
MRETRNTTVSDPFSISTSVSTIFAPYEIPSSIIDDLTAHLSQSSKLPEFLMRFHHALEEPAESRAMTCACTIALGYFIGGFVPLLPYFLVESHQAIVALCFSVVIVFIALFIFGYGKTCFVSGWSGSANVRKGILGGIQTIVVGSVAAGSAMVIVRIFHHLLSASEVSKAVNLHSMKN